MNQEILNQTNKICSMIEELESKKRLVILNDDLNSNLEAQKLMSDFENAKEKYYEVVKYSSKHPDFTKTSHQLIDAKIALFNNEIIKEIKTHENDLSKLTMEINNKISSLIPNKKKSCHKR